MAAKHEIEITANRYIHDTLSNFAYLFRSHSQQAQANGEGEGIAAFRMAALVFEAFSFEARINFIGHKILKDDWYEGAKTKEKVKLLYKTLELDCQWGRRPLQTTTDLLKFRNTLAHGKPEIIRRERQAVKKLPDVFEVLKSKWESDISAEFVERCQADCQEIWNLLLRTADIQPHETMTSGGYSEVRRSNPPTAAD